MFSTLSDTQRRLLLIGVPVVAAMVLATRLRGGGAPEPAIDGDQVEPADGQLGPVLTGTADTSAIDVGQLADFQTNLSEYLTMLARRIDQALGSSDPPPANRPPAITSLSNEALKAECRKVTGAGTAGQQPRYSRAAVQAEIWRRIQNRTMSLNRLTGSCREAMVQYALAHGGRPPGGRTGASTPRTAAKPAAAPRRRATTKEPRR